MLNYQHNQRVEFLVAQGGSARVSGGRKNAEMAKGKKRIVQAGRLLLGSTIADNKQRTPCVNYFESLR